jgi:hypothetical protein
MRLALHTASGRDALGYRLTCGSFLNNPGILSNKPGPPLKTGFFYSLNVAVEGAPRSAATRELNSDAVQRSPRAAG